MATWLTVGSRARVIGRRVVVAAVVVAQVVLVARGPWADHKEFAWRMFPDASTWRADVVRVTADGRTVPVDEGWEYRWYDLVPVAGMGVPSVRHATAAGVTNQLAYLDAALDWVADHTPADHETVYLQATVTYWRNARPPETVVLRSHDRDRAG